MIIFSDLTNRLNAINFAKNGLSVNTIWNVLINKYADETDLIKPTWTWLYPEQQLKIYRKDFKRPSYVITREDSDNEIKIVDVEQHTVWHEAI